MPSLPEFQPKSQKSKKYEAPETTSHPSKKPSLSSSSSQDSKENNRKQETGKDIGVIEFSMTNLLDTLAKQVKQDAQSQAQPALSTQPPEPTPIPIINHLSEDSSTEILDDDTSDDERSEPLQFVVGENSQAYKEEPISSSDEEMKYQPPEEKPTKKYASKVLVFTFDDIPFSKWNSRIDEFHAWMTSEALITPTDQVIQQFTARLSGALKEWWTSLGDYRQMLVLRTTIPALLGEIHREFIGTPNHLKDQIREEFFKAKCCSMNRKDLAKHFERQTKRYYALDGLNNPSLKHIYLASIDEYLGQQTIAYIKDQGTNIEEISIGQIQQYVFKTLDKLCKQKEFWSEFMDKTKSISKVCARPDLYIKCSKSKESCSCRTKKKKHHRRFREDKRSKFTKFRRKRFFRKKRGFKKSTKCFLCRKEGHYAKNCPNKSKQKKQYLVHSIAKIAPELDLEHHDLESVLSYDSDDEDALCGYSDSEEEYSDSSSTSNDECYKITHCPDPNVQTPHLPVTILDPNNDTPAIQAIAFIDTGAHTSIMNPKTLPKHMWLPFQQEFRVANASSLVIKLKSKPIIIELFPGCRITTQVLGSSAPGKDLILGWDSYHTLKKKFNISIEPGGIQWKSHFKSFTSVPRIFTVEGAIPNEIEEIRRNLTTYSCADSHKEFLQKCSSPLWLNPQFFVALPFKENIDTTPTKASHAGMPPALLQQANEECDQLMQQGLVTATNSPWACKAFYVNNRAEQVRGKLRLVIDYKPLNQFLQDVKFPLPTRRSLLQNLSGAKVFSKFDLKSGFWQLGIQPEEQYKTAFCLPNRHLQWKVLPFGLKTAPSLFQKAMLKIFKPILHTALIYIDDILLFSKKEEEHIQALRQFQQIVQDYGIMLSARKMILAQPNIEFLGVQITEGQFAPQAHLATELLEFPEENLTKRQVQQFLGVINYLSDFIPNLSKLTQPLRKMLTKNPPTWKTRQTEAVKVLKAAIQKLPPLKIPDHGLRIVQTDASDKYWGAVLFEENEGKRQICGYKSGRFKDSEIHYHSTFKEILAVKRAIEKFEFHLIGQKFRIEMDMSSFPKMLQFKQKMVPHQQLLRWSEWFSQYDFDAVYLKGTKNVLADMLSRKPPVSSILMMTETHQEEGLFDFISNMPEDAKELIKKENLHEESRRKIYHYQSIIIQRHGLINTFIQPLGIHPNFPFAHLFRINNTDMPEEVLCFLWYLCSIFTIGIILNTPLILHYLNQKIHHKTPSNKPECLYTFLNWFSSPKSWKNKLQKSNHILPNPQSLPHAIYLFHRPITIHPNTKRIHTMASLSRYSTFEYNLYPDDLPKDKEIFEQFQTRIFRVNNIDQPYPIPYDGKWNFYPITYQWDLDEDLNFHQEKMKKKNKGKLPCHAHPAGYSQENEYSTMDIDETTEAFKIKSPSQSPSGPSPIQGPSDSSPSYSTICANPSPGTMENNFEDYIEEYTCPDDGYGCCEEHMLEFEMDH